MNRNLKRFLICTFFILLAGAVHILGKPDIIKLRTNSIILALYTIPIIIWIEKNKQIILQKYMRKYLTYIGFTLIMYMLIRTIKYEIIPPDSNLDRYLWYSYYIFMMLIGVFLMFSILYIDKAEDEKIDKRWNLLYLPLAILSLLCITNDYHQMLFYFPLGLNFWSDSVKRHGIVFLLILAFLSLILISSVEVAVIKLLNRRDIKKILPTFTIFLIWGLYTYLYIKDVDNLYWLFVAYKSPEFNTLMVILFIESLIFSRLIPTNRDYDKFWKLSTLKIGIMDSFGRFYPSDKEDRNANISQVLKAENNPIYLDKNTLLESTKISNGWSYWISDITRINSIKKELKDLGNVISEENELLQAEKKMKKESSSIKRQIEIYEFIDTQLEDKLTNLEQSFDNLPDDENLFKEKMKIPTIIKVYIKRYSNMLLLSRKSDITSIIELKLAIEESLGYLELYDIMTILLWKGDGMIHINKILLAYKIFQELIECHISTMKAVIVTFKKRQNFMLLSLHIENPNENPINYKKIEEMNLEKDDISFENFIEENVLYVKIQIPEGDDVND